MVFSNKYDVTEPSPPWLSISLTRWVSRCVVAMPLISYLPVGLLESMCQRIKMTVRFFWDVSPRLLLWEQKTVP